MTNSPITTNIGITDATLSIVVRGLASPNAAAQAEALALLRARVPEGTAIQVEAIATLLRILGESQVPEDQLVPRFEEIVRRHLEMLERLRALEPQDPKTAWLVEAARVAIAAGRFEEADAALVQAEDAELAAASQAQALAEQAQAAAGVRLATAAATRAERGELARQQLDYLGAAAHFAEAAGIAPDLETVWEYQGQRASALNDQGSEFGDNAALTESIRLWREIVLPLTARERMPLDWARTQMNLGNALQTLGAREAGTARLEEAVAAFRAALEEWTRERVPLDWAATTGTEGVALTLLAERTDNATMARRAVEQITTARDVLREGGHTPWAAYFEERLEAAEAVRDGLQEADAAAR